MRMGEQSEKDRDSEATHRHAERLHELRAFIEKVSWSSYLSSIKDKRREGGNNLLDDPRSKS